MVQRRPGDAVRRAVARALSEERDPDALPQRLADVLAAELPVDGVGISLLCDRPYRLLLAASGPEAVLLEKAQITTGEGPCVDASTSRRSVLVSDLVDTAQRHWPGFAETVRLHAPHVRAVFAFPMLLFDAAEDDQPAEAHAQSLGCLDLYRYEPGPLNPTAYAEAAAAASAVTTAVLAGFNAQDLDPPERPDARASGSASVSSGSAYAWPQVYEAVGLLANRWSMAPDDALATIRAMAFASGRLLPETAEDLIKGWSEDERDDQG